MACKERHKRFRSRPKLQDGVNLTREEMDSIFSANAGVPFVDRILKGDTTSIQTPDHPGRSTHLMSSADNFIFPQVTQQGDSLTYNPEFPANIRSAIKNKNVIRFNSPEEAEFFGKNYKNTDAWDRYIGKLPKLQDGLDTSKENWNLYTPYDPEAEVAKENALRERITREFEQFKDIRDFDIRIASKVHANRRLRPKNVESELLKGDQNAIDSVHKVRAEYFKWLFKNRKYLDRNDKPKLYNGLNTIDDIPEKESTYPEPANFSFAPYEGSMPIYGYQPNPEALKYAKAGQESSGTVDFPKTDVRNQSGQQHSWWMYPNLTINELSNPQQKMTNEVIEMGLPMPGLETMGKIPSLYKAFKNYIPVAKRFKQQLGNTYSRPAIAAAKYMLDKEKMYKASSLLDFTERLLQYPFRGKKNKALQEGNEFVHNWFIHPNTRDRFDMMQEQRLHSLVGSDEFKLARDDTKQRFLDWEMEHPYIDDVIEAINTRSHLSSFTPLTQDVVKLDQERLFEGVAGLSIPNTPSKKFPQTRFNVVDDTTTPGQVRSTAIHEGTHGVTNGNLIWEDFYDRRKNFLFDNTRGPRYTGDKDYSYYTNPTELHARIMELRYAYKLKPGQKVTLEMAEKMLDDIWDNKTFVSPSFADYINGPTGLKNLMNAMPAAAGAVVGAKVLGNEKEETPKLQKGLDNTGMFGLIRKVLPKQVRDTVPTQEMEPIIPEFKFAPTNPEIQTPSVGQPYTVPVPQDPQSYLTSLGPDPDAEVEPKTKSATKTKEEPKKETITSVIRKTLDPTKQVDLSNVPQGDDVTQRLFGNYYPGYPYEARQFPAFEGMTSEEYQKWKAYGEKYMDPETPEKVKTAVKEAIGQDRYDDFTMLSQAGSPIRVARMARNFIEDELRERGILKPHGAVSGAPRDGAEAAEIIEGVPSSQNYISSLLPEPEETPEPGKLPFDIWMDDVPSPSYGRKIPSVIRNTKGIYHRPMSIDLKGRKFGIHNRGGAYEPGIMGTNVTTLYPFVGRDEKKPGRVKGQKGWTWPTEEQKDSKMVIGVAPDGSIKFGYKKSDFNKDDKVAIAQKISDVKDFMFDNDGSLSYKKLTSGGNAGAYMPKLVLEDGNEKLLPFLSYNHAQMGNRIDYFFGGGTGGQVILESGNEMRFVRGAPMDVYKEFKRLKDKHGKVNIITLDSGTFAAGMDTDKKGGFTASDLKKYEDRNASGGHFLYFK